VRVPVEPCDGGAGISVPGEIEAGAEIWSGGLGEDAVRGMWV